MRLNAADVRILNVTRVTCQHLSPPQTENPARGRVLLVLAVVVGYCPDCLRCAAIAARCATAIADPGDFSVNACTIAEMMAPVGSAGIRAD